MVAAITRIYFWREISSRRTHEARGRAEPQPDGEEQMVEESNQSMSVLHIEQADWVLAGQLTENPCSKYWPSLRQLITRNIYIKLCITERTSLTARGLLWVVPRNMRHQVVKAAHDNLGHFATEKTLTIMLLCLWPQQDVFSGFRDVQRMRIQEIGWSGCDKVFTLFLYQNFCI